MVQNQNMEPTGTRTFQAGDILIACDNVNGMPIGYMGHAAIVVDQSQLVEAVPYVPYIREDTIEQFLKAHPTHVQYRPKSKTMGEHAANVAISYANSYEENRKQGINQPVFSFNLHVALNDPWNSVYCSKLVWMSYFYGANYLFPNDFLLFAPEDLATDLQNNPNFEAVYKHSEFGFLVDL